MNLKPTEILAIISISITILYGIIFRDYWKEGLIVGLISTTALLVVDLKIAISDSENNKNLESEIQKLESEIQKLKAIEQQSIEQNIINYDTFTKKIKSHIDYSNRKLLELLKIKIDYFHEQELFSSLDNIISLAEEAKSYNYNLTAYCSMLNRKIQEIKQVLGDGFTTFTKDNEHQRASLLEQIVFNSSEYVYAVTFDEDQYIDIFWNGLFQDRYITSNLYAATKGTRIERIFIVDEKIIKNSNLSPKEKDKRDKLIALCKKLNQGHSNSSAYWVSKESLPGSLANITTSFLICDDIHVSESSGMTKEGKLSTDGYVTSGGEKEKIDSYIRPLWSRFLEYKKRKKTEDCNELESY